MAVVLIAAGCSSPQRDDGSVRAAHRVNVEGIDCIVMYSNGVAISCDWGN